MDFRKVGGETGLAVPAFNLRRVLNMMGTRKLVKAITIC